MTLARRCLVNPSEPGWYHCISRCVRRAFLCGGDKEHRKSWVVDRLKPLAQCFAVEVAGYAVMLNHLHMVLRVDSLAPQGWSAETVAEQWLTVFPSQYLSARDAYGVHRERISLPKPRTGRGSPRGACGSGGCASALRPPGSAGPAAPCRT